MITFLSVAFWIGFVPIECESKYDELLHTSGPLSDVSSRPVALIDFKPNDLQLQKYF